MAKGKGQIRISSQNNGKSRLSFTQYDLSLRNRSPSIGNRSPSPIGAKQPPNSWTVPLYKKDKGLPGHRRKKSLLHRICQSYTVKRTRTNSWVPDSLTSVSGKIMERVLSGCISGHAREKKVTGNSQHGFAKGKSRLTHLIAFCDKSIGLADDGDQCMTFTSTLARALPPSLTKPPYPS